MMKIQFNTDKTVHGDERVRDFFTAKISDELLRYQSHISRVEVHITDQNGKKEGWNDIHCLLEARIEARTPVAVSNQADTVEMAISGAVDKLKAALETILGRMQNH